MSIAKVGEVMGCEVTALGRGVLICELDSGERAIMLPSGLREGLSFDSVKEHEEFRVLIVEKREGRDYRSTFVVTMKLDAEVFDPDHLEEAADRRQPPKPNPELVAKYPAGRKVSGRVVRSTGDGIVVMVDNVTRALLPFGELGATKQASLRDKCNVKAVVLRVEGNQLVLTRKAA